MDFGAPCSSVSRTHVHHLGQRPTQTVSDVPPQTRQCAQSVVPPAGRDERTTAPHSLTHSIACPRVLLHVGALGATAFALRGKEDYTRPSAAPRGRACIQQQRRGSDVAMCLDAVMRLTTRHLLCVCARVCVRASLSLSLSLSLCVCVCIYVRVWVCVCGRARACCCAVCVCRLCTIFTHSP